MCKCTPEIRTPFCGKLGCEWPKQEGEKMDTVIINNIEYVRKDSIEKVDLSNSEVTFLQIGKIYLIRTVTMIYTGRIKAMSKNEILLEEAAWIPETERWFNTCKNEIFKEIEPYYRDAILFKGAILDATEITKTHTEQK